VKVVTPRNATAVIKVKAMFNGNCHEELGWLEIFNLED